MSRSYKHNPGFNDNSLSNRRFYKRRSSKIVRQAEVVSDGMNYKKLHGINRWDICDWSIMLRDVDTLWGQPIYKWYMK